MNIKIFALLLLSLLSELAVSQVVNRYPVVQRPNQTSATIAWRRANASSGKLYLGTAPGVWFDSVATTTATQKHHFDLAGLQPNIKYYYQVKSTAPNDTFVSAVEHFYTSPLDRASEISFLAYGDCGYNNTTQHTVKALMETEIVDFAIVTGDIDQGNGDDYDNVFFGVYKDMLKQDCHFTCIGNHDTYADNAATYLDDFYLFSNNPANTERYYSFEWGNSKFICLDANLPYTTGSDQHDWMLDELKCNDKKWLIVFFHQPPWTNAWSLDYYVPFTPYFRYQGDEDMRTDLVPNFELYGVDFVVNGHSHCYQRGEMNGVQYLITGGAGSSSIDNNTNSNAPNISVEIYENHYVRFDINGDTAKYVMINDQNLRQDSVQVIKTYTPYQNTASVSPISCNQAADGSIALTTVGPKPPYTYYWSNGETTSTVNNLDTGMYTVEVISAVGCSRIDTFMLTNPPIPTTQIDTPQGTLICTNQSVPLSATGNHTSYLWSTGETTASISANQAQQYMVTVYDAQGCASVPNTIMTTAAPAPNASFQDSINGLTLSLYNNSIGEIVQWSFGDGNTSTDSIPSNTYATAGTYNVQLIVQNACGNDTTAQLITVSNPNSVSQLQAYQALQPVLQPNPVQDVAVLSFNNDKGTAFDVVITTVAGKKVREYLGITSNKIRIPKEDLAAGTYFYTLRNKELSYSGKIVIE